MDIFLISLRKRAKCYIVFLKRVKANFFHSISHIDINVVGSKFPTHGNWPWERQNMSLVLTTQGFSL